MCFRAFLFSEFVCVDRNFVWKRESKVFQTLQKTLFARCLATLSECGARNPLRATDEQPKIKTWLPIPFRFCATRFPEPLFPPAD